MKLHPQFLNLVPQALVFIVGTDKSEVPLPHVKSGICGPVDQLFQGSERIEYPYANKTRVDPVARLERDQPGLKNKGDAEGDPRWLFRSCNNPDHIQPINPLAEEEAPNANGTVRPRDCFPN